MLVTNDKTVFIQYSLFSVTCSYFQEVEDYEVCVYVSFTARTLYTG